MYFRQNHTPEIWCFDDTGHLSVPLEIGLLTERSRRAVKCSRMNVPNDWKVCNGFILPSNYLNTKGYESIFKSYNCFRSFLSSGKQRFQSVLDSIARNQGVAFDNLEARKVSEEVCNRLFNMTNTRNLSATERLTVARELWVSYHLSFSQISGFCHIPEDEIRKYLK